MKPLRVLLLSLALIAAAPATFSADVSSGGFVDGKKFRALIDESKDVVEVNLDGAILQAIAKAGSGDKDAHDADDLFTKLKSIHAVIGTVKGSASDAQALVQKTDQSLVGSGWQRITRITDATSSVSVLTHTVGDKVDGLVALIFDSEDNELVFANLAGEIDVTRLGEIGHKFNISGLDAIPGKH